jgi:oligoribonuclease (3'-5' exoribonuclease)
VVSGQCQVSGDDLNVQGFRRSVRRFSIQLHCAPMAGNYLQNDGKFLVNEMRGLAGIFAGRG